MIYTVYINHLGSFGYTQVKLHKRIHIPIHFTSAYIIIHHLLVYSAWKMNWMFHLPHHSLGSKTRCTLPRTPPIISPWNSMNIILRRHWDTRKSIDYNYSGYSLIARLTPLVDYAAFLKTGMQHHATVTFGISAEISRLWFLFGRRTSSITKMKVSLAGFCCQFGLASLLGFAPAAWLQTLKLYLNCAAKPGRPGGWIDVDRIW